MYKQPFIPYVTKRNKIPEIPKTTEKIREALNTIEKGYGRFKIVNKGQTETMGTNHETSLLLECRFCKSQFTGQASEGCFHSYINPMSCPVCGFPNNLIKALYQSIEDG